jgi:hypothetical protein
MDTISIAAFSDELQKIALLEELVEKGLKDVRGTPRILMRQRNPEEIAGTVKRVSNLYNKIVSKPVKKMIYPITEPIINRLPSKVQPGAKFVREEFVKDPIGIAATQLSPVPGTMAAYLASKHLAEKALNLI